jgi:septum formation protein
MNFKRPLILASSSPRRQFLLRAIGFDFNVCAPGIDENFAADSPVEQVPLDLARRKAMAVELPEDAVVLAADTIVVLNNGILNKPTDRDDAVRMLSSLAGKTHRVITGVCLRSATGIDAFTDAADVTFQPVTASEIEFYVDHFHPLDKAGAYGAQDTLPAGMNPCSGEEMKFLKSIGKTDLVANTVTPPKGRRVVLIEKIQGAYFTVMGLPIHRVYPQLLAR